MPEQAVPHKDFDEPYTFIDPVLNEVSRVSPEVSQVLPESQALGFEDWVHRVRTYATSATLPPGFEPGNWFAFWDA
jgi:hypothetical protein